MARTILYTERSGQPPPPITFGGPSPRTREKATKPDDYTGKLVKYVPAEVLAFFAPMAAAVEGRRDLLIAAMVAALLATPAYLWLGAKRLPPEQKPLVHMYPLSAIAFLAWALGTSSLGSLFGLDSITKAFTLGISVFLIPLIDGLIEQMGK